MMGVSLGLQTRQTPLDEIFRQHVHHITAGITAASWYSIPFSLCMVLTCFDTWAKQAYINKMPHLIPF